MIRTFIGIELEPEMRADISQEISYLHGHFPKVRWVRPENLHLTLKFVGTIKPNELSDVFTATEDALADCDPFSLQLSGLGAYPDAIYPRTIWAGCAMGRDRLQLLAKNIEDELATLGYPPERRPYSPHLTLGRVKQPSFARGIEEYIEDGKQMDFGACDISEVVVYMSELKKDGAIYSPMHHIKL